MDQDNSEYLAGKLALGPVVAIWAMASLRRIPASLKMAGGNR